jgi:hypothetical protein
MSNNTSPEGMQLNRSLLVGGGVLVGIGGLLGLTGMVLVGSALLSATRQWVNQLEQPVLGKPAAAVALALAAGSCGPGPAPPPCARRKGLAARGHRRSSRPSRRPTVAPKPPVDRHMRRA